MLKYKISILFILIMFMCTFTFIKANNDIPLIGKIIYIDSGHGGRDSGAIYKDIKEADINLSISKYLKETLEKQGAIVYMTRYYNNDLSKNSATNKKKSDLNERARIINESNANIFISIHLNSDTSSTWSGAQTFYTNKNTENQKIAQILQEQFTKNLNTKREAKQIKNMYLFDRIKVPGVLVEAGFISNPNDRYLLTQKEYQQKIATIITSALIKYYQSS